MLFGEAKCANLGRPNVSILGVANVLRPSDTQSNFDDCIMGKFEDLEGEIDAMMKDFKTLG